MGRKSTHYGRVLVVEDSKVVESNFLLVKPKTSLSSSNTAVVIGVYSNGEQIESFRTTFIGRIALINNLITIR